jgi:predicted GNAT family N-acyltransferase
MDPACDHAIAVLDGQVVGTGRLLPAGVIGRMAVAETDRGAGIGAAVLAALEQRAAERGHTEVELHAQLHAAGFYDRAGYERVSDVYLEAGIEHVTMRKPLSPTS